MDMKKIKQGLFEINWLNALLMFGVLGLGLWTINFSDVYTDNIEYKLKLILTGTGCLLFGFSISIFREDKEVK